MAEQFTYLYVIPKDAVLGLSTSGPSFDKDANSFIGLSTLPPGYSSTPVPVVRAPQFLTVRSSEEAFACGGLLQQRAHGILPAPISFFFFFFFS